jgi:hypothetical protein
VHSRTILVALLLLTVAAFFAFPVDIASANTTSGTVSFTTAYKYAQINGSSTTYVGWNATIYMNSTIYGLGSTNYINFTSASFSNSGPAKTFGVAAADGNVNVTKITTNYVQYSLSCTPSSPCHAWYYYKTVPTWVKILVNGVETDVTSFSGSTSCTAPCTYNSGTYLQTNVVYHSPTTIQMHFDSAPGPVTTTTQASTTQGGGSGANFFNFPTTTSTQSTSQTPQASGQLGLDAGTKLLIVIVALAVLVVAVALYVGDKPRRSQLGKARHELAKKYR